MLPVHRQPNKAATAQAAQDSLESGALAHAAVAGGVAPSPSPALPPSLRPFPDGQPLESLLQNAALSLIGGAVPSLDAEALRYTHWAIATAAER